MYSRIDTVTTLKISPGILQRITTGATAYMYIIYQEGRIPPRT